MGGAFGNPAVGSTVGSSLGATISKWLGSGDYSVSSNSLVSRVSSGSPAIPVMHSGGQTVTVRHKEYLGEIRGSTAFAVQHVYDLNPGLTYTFPWLSSLARSFQEYKIKGLVFHYVPTSGTAISGTNPAIGSVMIQTSYRATEAQPTSKVEMLNEYWAAEAATNEAFCHPIECDPKENPFNVQYIRNGALPGTENQLMYDLGRTFVATSGQPATGNVVGDLWVTYEVELKKPVVSSSVTAPIEYISVSITPPVSTTSWFGTSVAQQKFTGSLAVTLLNNTLTFPKGTVGAYCIVVRIYATASFVAIDLGGAATFTGCIETSMYPNTAAGAAGYFRNTMTAAGSSMNTGFYVVGVTVFDPQVVASVVFPSVSWTGTPTAVDISVTSLA